MSDPVEDIQRWVDHGAEYRVLELSDEHALVQLCTCYGEPVELLESDDPRLVAWLREAGPSPGTRT
jgi:hypothetical protein